MISRDGPTGAETEWTEDANISIAASQVVSTASRFQVKNVTRDGFFQFFLISVSRELISGDLNPIHMSSFMARMLGHKCSLAHGFSILSKVFELYETEYSKIKEIDIKFLRPLYLPNTVSLFIYPKKDLKQKFIVVSMDKKKIHAAGSVLS